MPASVNCSVLIEPVDASPIRSPQSTHSVIARRVAGLSVVEVGTRNGDGMACFSRTATRAVAVEMSPSYCVKLRHRAVSLQGVPRTPAFEVLCNRYEQAGLPDADVYTWWQQWPHLTNHRLLSHLARRQEQGLIRASAVAVFLVDTGWGYDRRSWRALSGLAAWSETVRFDEQTACLGRAVDKKERSACARAKGEFLIAGVPIRNVASSPMFAGRTTRPEAQRHKSVALRPRTSPTRHVGVCLTGLQRSFPEIAHSVKDGTYQLAGPDSQLTFFGVKPPEDDWSFVAQQLPLSAMEPQVQCDPAVSWLMERYYHCDGKSRGGASGCRHSFLQEICDLDHCWRMMQAHEAQHQFRWDALMRIRLDVLWEVRPTLPHTFESNEIFVPWMDSASGVNDHVASGGRDAMVSFLSRKRHLNSTEVWQKSSIASLHRNYERTKMAASRPRITAEKYLHVVLLQDGIKIRQLDQLAYCLHTRKALLEQGTHGCIARARARTECQSLVCYNGMRQNWCSCFDTPCATIRGSNVSKLTALETTRAHVRLKNPQQVRCIDAAGKQRLGRDSPGVRCPWSRDEFRLYANVFVARADNCTVRWTSTLRTSSKKSLMQPPEVWSQALRGKREVLKRLSWRELQSAAQSQGLTVTASQVKSKEDYAEILMAAAANMTSIRGVHGSEGANLAQSSQATAAPTRARTAHVVLGSPYGTGSKDGVVPSERMLQLHLWALGQLETSLSAVLVVLSTAEASSRRVELQGYTDIASERATLACPVHVLRAANNSLGSYGMYLLAYATYPLFDYYIASEVDYIPMHAHFDKLMVAMHLGTFAERPGLLVGCLQGEPLEKGFPAHPQGAHIMTAGAIGRIFEHIYGRSVGWTRSTSDRMVHLVRSARGRSRSGSRGRYDMIQEGFGMLLREAGIEMRDFTGVFRSPYWNHRELLDWTGITNDEDNRSRVLPVRRMLFAPVQMLYFDSLRRCCGHTWPSCRAKRTSCAINSWRRDGECCADERIAWPAVRLRSQLSVSPSTLQGATHLLSDDHVLQTRPPSRFWRVA